MKRLGFRGRKRRTLPNSRSCAACGLAPKIRLDGNHFVWPGAEYTLKELLALAPFGLVFNPFLWRRRVNVGRAESCGPAQPASGRAPARGAALKARAVPEGPTRKRAMTRVGWGILLPSTSSPSAAQAAQASIELRQLNSVTTVFSVEGEEICVAEALDEDPSLRAAGEQVHYLIWRDALDEPQVYGPFDEEGIRDITGALILSMDLLTGEAP